MKYASVVKKGNYEIQKSSDLVRELDLLIRSGYGLICLGTADEERAEGLIKHLADQKDLPLFTWNLSHGLRRVDLEKPMYGTADPKVALGHLETSKLPAVYYFQGLEAFLEDPMISAKLSAAARSFTEIDGALILTGHQLQIPERAKPYTAFLATPTPTPEDYSELVQHIYRDLSVRMNIGIEMTDAQMEQLLNHLNGLTMLEAQKILTKAMVEDGKLAPDDLKLVIDAKKTIIERDGLLEYYPVEESMADIADLAGLKSWLAKRATILREPQRAEQYGLSFPKGVLLIGIPGSGKSLCAKAVATEWKLPLLKMDPSRLYNKYIGESEKNFKRATETAAKMAPLVLWIDEIEKAFATDSGEDGGVSRRVLGIFLSWMQERHGDVFVVATANDVTKLPPEFLRKGRFDEIFFLDLPDCAAKAVIFEIHLKRRGHSPDEFKLARLAQEAEGFSGAEIEQVVISALYSAFSNNEPLTQEALSAEIRATVPLSQTHREYLARLRKWAENRTVPAQ